MPFISVELYIGAAVLEVTIEDPFFFKKLITSKHYREKAPLVVAQEQPRRDFVRKKPLFQSLALGIQERLSK